MDFQKKEILPTSESLMSTLGRLSPCSPVLFRDSRVLEAQWDKAKEVRVIFVVFRRGKLDSLFIVTARMDFQTYRNISGFKINA